MTAKHVHIGGLYFIGFVASLYAVNFLARTIAARHPDSPAVQALVYGL